jgi:hypothetical protein
MFRAWFFQNNPGLSLSTGREMSEGRMHVTAMRIDQPEAWAFRSSLFTGACRPGDIALAVLELGWHNLVQVAHYLAYKSIKYTVLW